MTKKKRNHPDLEEVLNRPWCYYCERDFDDLKILINHQKAKHFKCERCGRRLNTAGGLSVHMSQVHKENLTAVDNALPNRAGLDIEIFGMEGIPEDIAQQHNQRVLTTYHQAQAERQAANGNSTSGTGGPSGPKKPKIEAPSDLKKRLAEHKAAKLSAEHGGGSDSGSGTPQPTAPPPHTHTAGSNGFNSSPSYPPYQQQPYNPPPTNAAYSQPSSYSPATGYSQHPGYGPPAAPQSTYGHPPTTQSYPQPQPYAQPPQPSFQQQGQGPYPPQPAFSPPPYQTQAPYSGHAYSQNGPHQYLGPPGGSRPFGAGSPAPPYPQHTSSPSNGPFPQPVRTGTVSLPNAPGLPQRPAFGAPPVNAFQFQQMHQGQIPASQNHVMQPQYPKQATPPTAPQPQVNGPIPVSMSQAPNAASIDDLISSASKQADANAATPRAPTPPANAQVSAATPTPAPTKEDHAEDKAGKKEREKSKATRLVYSDNETSPEEKMAMLPRYAFTHA